MKVGGEGGRRILDVDGKGAWVGVGGLENWTIFMDVMCNIPNSVFHLAKYPFKRPKMSQKQRIPSMAITELQPSAYIQGMSLVIDNSSGDVEMPFSAELASSQINEPGAITIPIQVTFF